ncbi:hypothetical protein SAMN04487850_2090 [Prevotella aff. ruminicola Tc2-24]|jgi:hypothetical protein|uniref:Uncharacterized protein n=1 Tax=Prevotella aff. ruminicola Tc2-24 TaxID=81582 RepID=A0A1I0PZU3_9BACT|nr:hypothetical protein SAMN04487828_1394 [Prevotella sp. lc2012]SEW20041.1 hypothetical protein SAMN04487850_2090 [Prevotella aff. ruminicola Tc2-24]
MRDLLQQEIESKQEPNALYEKLGYSLWFFPIYKELERIE